MDKMIPKDPQAKKLRQELAEGKHKPWAECQNWECRKMIPRFCATKYVPCPYCGHAQ